MSGLPGRATSRLRDAMTLSVANIAPVSHALRADDARGGMGLRAVQYCEGERGASDTGTCHDSAVSTAAAISSSSRPDVADDECSSLIAEGSDSQGPGCSMAQRVACLVIRWLARALSPLWFLLHIVNATQMQAVAHTGVRAAATAAARQSRIGSVRLSVALRTACAALVGGSMFAVVVLCVSAFCSTSPDGMSQGAAGNMCTSLSPVLPVLPFAAVVDDSPAVCGPAVVLTDDIAARTVWIWWTQRGTVDAADAAGAGAGATFNKCGWDLRQVFGSAVTSNNNRGSLRLRVVSADMTRGPHASVPLHRFPLPPYFDVLPYNHQGDFGSIALLAEYGGVYLDTDVFVLHDLWQYFRLLQHFEFIGFGGHRGDVRSGSAIGWHDRAVHHGVMLSRRGAQFAVRAYHAALRMYATKYGCDGHSCASTALGWLDTLDAFTAAARDVRAGWRSHCLMLRLPTRHYEPGLMEHEDLCAPETNEFIHLALRVADNGSFVPEGADLQQLRAERAQWVTTTMERMASGTIRSIHLSGTIGALNVRKDVRVMGVNATEEACPLLRFAWLVATHQRDDVQRMLHAVAALTMHTWPQHLRDWYP